MEEMCLQMIDTEVENNGRNMEANQWIRRVRNKQSWQNQKLQARCDKKVLYSQNGRKTFKVHRLVAEVFLPNPNCLPQINHKDENRENNRVDNLEWCDNNYNYHYGTHIDRVREENMCCPTTSRRIYSVDADGNTRHYDSIGEAERKPGCPIQIL